ncbi:ABC transporter substrate-binding protein [Derxia gummosa]|uniref:ABC transporter substrate-binding protein n=1 Tax=Derxia gummosa DSM 723 TaxID=1121388 RepID=A0A9U5GCA9_9BURK|nr:ABC transporter substrate-binding protein [Derxia gummosa]
MNKTTTATARLPLRRWIAAALLACGMSAAIAAPPGAGPASAGATATAPAVTALAAAPATTSGGAVAATTTGPAAMAIAPAAVATPAQPAAPAGLVRVADGRLLAPEIARIVERGELVVAMLGTDQPPFFEERDGELVGVEVDMAHEIARELKVPKVRFNREAKTFNQVVDVVARREADLGISKLSRTLARAQVIRFSEPYLRLNHALVLNRVAFARLALDRPVTAVVRDFGGTLGVIEKSSFADYATRNFSHATLKTYPKWDDVVTAVRKGEVVGAYRDEFEIKRLLKADPTASLTLRTVTLKDLEDTLGIAVNMQDPVLLAFVNQYLEQRPAKLDIDKVLQAVTDAR